MLDTNRALNRMLLQMAKCSLDNEDVDYKLKWLEAEANKHKRYFWQSRLTIPDLKEIDNKMYNPDTVEIGDWMIKKRTVKVYEKRICFNPSAFCWDSGKRLFLKPAMVVKTVIEGPGDPLRETFYFEPKRYTTWLLKN